MIKLLKYDWKRNANVLLVAVVIFLLVQAAVTTIGWLNDWNIAVIVFLSSFLYMMGGFLAFLMMCQTFNYNIKAYSRRLLPIPSIHTITSPIILVFLTQLAILIIFIVHANLFLFIFDTSELNLDRSLTHVDFLEATSFILSYVWGTLITIIVIFFSITFSKTIEGKGGTLLGIVVCIALFILPAYLSWVIFPEANSSSQSIGFLTLESTKAANGTLNMELIPFEGMDWLVLLFEGAIMAALIYGIVYMMDRKIKL